MHLAVKIHELLPKSKKHCHRYVTKLLQYIDVPFSNDEKIARTTFNLVSKAYVLNESDIEKKIGCLGRKEKLSTEKKEKKEKEKKEKTAELVKTNNTPLDDLVSDDWNFDAEQSSLNPIGYSSHPSSQQ